MRAEGMLTAQSATSEIIGKGGRGQLAYRLVVLLFTHISRGEMLVCLMQADCLVEMC